jgi:adenylate cyclase
LVTTVLYRYALGRNERAVIRRAFEHYVAPAIVRRMLDDPSRLALGGETCDLTVMFTDLEGFTTVAEALPPAEVRERLSAYLTAMMDELLAEQATLDKFLGDGIMAYFGAPLPDPRHAVRACRAALAMQRRLADINTRTPTPWRMRIGLNTGAAVAGNMGTNTIFNFTVIGDTVNLASRLEGANKEYGSLILAGEETWRRSADDFEWRELDWLRVKGATRPMPIYELLGEKGSLTAARRHAISLFADGLAAYRAGRWDIAERVLRDAQALDSTDRPVAVLLARCVSYSHNPPGPEWDGVHSLMTK